MPASKKSIKSDLARLDAMSDDEIDYSDLPPLDDAFFTKDTIEWPPLKKTITIRLDADLLDWLKAQGKGYQTRINALLRRYMQAQKQRERQTSEKTEKTS